jgi:hypothetical protein
MTFKKLNSHIECENKNLELFSEFMRDTFGISPFTLEELVEGYENIPGVRAKKILIKSEKVTSPIE